MMKLFLVAAQGDECHDYRRAVNLAGWELAAELDFARLDAALNAIQADAAVLVSRRVDDVVLRALRCINARKPMPVVLLTADSLQRSIRTAVSAGVSAYVVDCTDISRLGYLLDVAMVRFTETQQLKKELHKAKATLAERNTVEKAKGIIMRQRKVSEDAAYQLLRKLAMDRNRRIGEVAGEVIAAAEVLI
jgi:response regulator NasT